MQRPLLFLSLLLVIGGVFLIEIQAKAEERKAAYVGSETCKGCHDAQYERFTATSKKARSYGSIQKMQKKLTPAEFNECLKCHTTGYGEPGGFRSADETPSLKNPSCEVCHGPGSLHADSGDPDDLTVKVSIEVCIKCHRSDRVAAFGFKPLLFAGAH
jgi:hypothetical protein